MFGIPNVPPASYLTLSLRNLGYVSTLADPHTDHLISCRVLLYRFGTLNTNLLTIPSTVLATFTMLGITMLSEVLNERTIVSMMEDLWTLPFLVALYCLPENPNQWLYFVNLSFCGKIDTYSIPQGLASGLLSYP